MKLIASRKDSLEPLKFKNYLFIKVDKIIPDDSKIIQHNGFASKTISCVDVKTKYVYHQRFNHLTGSFFGERRGEWEVCTLDSVENYLLLDYEGNVSFHRNDIEIWNISKDKLPSFHNRTMIWDDGLSHTKRNKGKITRFVYHDIVTLEKRWEYHTYKSSSKCIKSISQADNIIMLGLDDKSKVGLDRKTGEYIWECFGTESHNLNTFLYGRFFINYYGLDFFEFDAYSGELNRSLKLTNLEKYGIRGITRMRIEKDKIFFFDRNKVGVLDYSTLELIYLVTVPNLSDEFTESLNRIEVHEGKIYLVGITNKANAVSYIYQI